MQSKVSWFNRGVITQDLRSVGWIGIVYLMILLFSVPLQLVMMHGNERYSFQFTETGSLFALLDGFQIFLIFTIPVLLGITILRYLHVKASADFIHSLPIKRSALFNNHVIFGSLLLILPVLITAAVTAVTHGVLKLDEYFTFADIATWFGITILMDLLVFILTLLIGTITGISAVQGALTYISLIFPAGILILFYYNLKYFIFGFAYDYHFDRNIEYLTPIVRMVEITRWGITAKEITIYIVLLIVFYLLGMFAYNKRHIEGATQAIAFRFLKPIFKYGVTFCAMLLSGMYFGATQGDDFGWVLFGYFIGSIIGYIVAEIILQKSWRVFKSLKWYVAYGIVVIATGFLLNLDITGYEKQVPAVNDIERAYFGDNVHYLQAEENMSDSEAVKMNAISEKDRYYFSDKENIGSIVILHKKLIDDKNEIHNNNLGRYYKNIAIAYELKDGSKLVRQYQVPEDSYTSLYKVIYESDEYRYSHNELLRLKEEVTIDKIRVSSHNFIPKSYETTDAEQIAEMVKALKYDMEHEPYEEMFDHREPWGDIELLLENDQRVHITWKKSYNQFDNWLEGENLLDKTRVVPSDIEYVVVAKSDKWQNAPHWSSEEVIQYIENNEDALKIENPEEIAQCLLQTTWAPDREYIVAVYPKGSGSPMVQGLVEAPEFIVEQLN
ncbi:ABC transporter permease [Bacillus sp. Marseille-P3661]|uniref:ABC transporter permease n=1 Tax=Bacillus sp. Marseille-P3661 TaxID=1936234 RepID=UPI000C826DBB|nr:ABC transporter permease [Bacillus sp. Marseille-P3661]